MKVKVTVNHIYYTLTHIHEVTAYSASFLANLRRSYGPANVTIKKA